MDDYPVYVIIGEFNGIQDKCMVFCLKKNAVKKFEELTGLTMEQHNNGEYEYVPGAYYWHFFERYHEDWGESSDDDEDEEY